MSVQRYTSSMPMPVDSIWTSQQIVLSTILLTGAVILARRHTATTIGRLKFLRPSLAVILVLDGFFILARGGNPIGVRPDSWSDANVVASGRNYARLGLASNALAAQHQVTSDAHPNDPFYVYTQYPVASNILNGAWQLAGVTSDRAYRVIPAACSLLALGLWFGIFRRFGGDTLAAAATAVMGTSYAFLAYADNLHFHGYAHYTTAACVACYLRWTEAAARSIRRLILACICGFVGALFTWEYHIWLLLFVVLHGLLFRPPRWKQASLVFLLLLVTASIIPFVQRQQALASAGAASIKSSDARATFLHDIYRRTVGFSTGADSAQMGVSFTNYPLKVMLNFYCMYGVPLIAIMVIGLALVKGEGSRWTRPVSWSPELRLLLILAAAGVGWWCTMFQHTAVHLHVMRQCLPAYAWAMALVGVRCFQISGADSNWLRRGVGAAVFITLAYAHFEGTICAVRQHVTADFRDPRGRSDGGFFEGRMLPNCRRRFLWRP